MSNCAQHKKEVAGITDMKLLAEMIGDLHYETLGKLLDALADKIYADGQKDFVNGRPSISHHLYNASHHIADAFLHIEKAWEISKPFMDNTLK